MPKRKQLEWVRRGDCIECTSHRGAFGCSDYPRVSINKRQVTLHRVICERRNGTLGKLVARHTCDNPKCIRPDHIIPGSHGDNSADRNQRNRHAFGVRNGQAKLTDSLARKIFSANGTHREIASRFGVEHRTVGRIKSRQRWNHIH